MSDMVGINLKHGLLITGVSLQVKCNQCGRVLGAVMERKVDFWYSNGRTQCLLCIEKNATARKRAKALDKARAAKERLRERAGG